MKAYYLDIKNDPDQGAFIVFANTRNEARSQADSNNLMYDTWLDIQAIRANEYDGLESLKNSELQLKQWRNGWRWFDVDYLDPDETTDTEFYEWYKSNFEIKL